MGEAQEASGAAIFLHNTWTGPGQRRSSWYAALSSARRKICGKKSGYNDPTLMMIVKDEAGQTV
jgi:hypothetical protein